MGWPWKNHSQCKHAVLHPLGSLGVLLNVAFEVDLSTFWQEALATFLTATTQNVTAGLGAHARAESVLTLAGALGWLVGAFHGESGWWFKNDFEWRP